MADYRDRYPEIRAAGASVAAVSVDAAEVSEALRLHLGLPFPILCDTGRRVVREWDVYNSRERGGIAKPAVFIIGQDGVVRYAAIDHTVKRVTVTAMLGLLRSVQEARPVERRFVFPLVAHWRTAIRNLIRR